MPYQNDPLKVLTGEVRLSYLTVTAPRAAAVGADPKYSVTLLIPKTDLATKADIDASIQAAMQEATAKVWGGAYPPMIGTPKYQGYEYPKNGFPIYDGDGVKSSGEPFGEECRGHWVITASSKDKPGVVGIDNVNADLAPNDIYSGMYGRVTIRFFGYSQNGNKGIGCGLGNIMKTREGEPLSGSASASSDFAGVGNAVINPQAAGGLLPATPNYAAPGYVPPAPPVYQQPAYPQPSYPAPAQPAYQQQQQSVYINPLTGQPLPS